MAIQLSLKNKNFLNSVVSHYISLNNTFYKNKKNKFSSFSIYNTARGSLFGRPTLFSFKKHPYYSLFKLAKLYKFTFQKISKNAKHKQLLQLKKFKIRMNKNYILPYQRKSVWSPINLKKEYLYPAIQIKSDKIKSFNSLPYKWNIKAKKIYNTFYNITNNKSRNIIKEESRLDIVLYRAHWAISLKQAQQWIKSNKISTKKLYLNSGDTITPHSSILPTILKNQLSHLDKGTAVPSYLKSYDFNIIFLRKPLINEINVPLNMTKKLILT